MCYKEAVQKVATLLAVTQDVGEHPSAQHQHQKLEHCKSFHENSFKH